jgi:hypothetical protein
MAHLVALDGRAVPGPSNLESLYWWRRTAPQAAIGDRAVSLERLAYFAGASDAASVADLPGNRLRELAERRRQHDLEAEAVRSAAADVEAIADLHVERREAAFAMATGVLATLAPAAAALYSVVGRHPIALGFALAGLCAASVALVQAVRWFMALRSVEPQAMAAET